MRATAAAAALALLGGCAGGQGGDTDAAAPGLSVTLESEDVESGARPRLTLSCGEVGRAVMLHLVRRLDPPPANAAGVFGTDGGRPVRVALRPVRDDVWAPRMDDAGRADLIRRLLAARRVYFTGPLGTTDHVYRWDLARLGDALPRLRAACA